MTYRDLRLLMEGQMQALTNQQHLLAWQTAILLQPHMKKGSTVTPAQLLGERKEFRDVPEMKEHMRAVAERTHEVWLSTREEEERPHDPDAAVLGYAGGQES